MSCEIRFKLENTLRGEDVRNKPAFTCMVSAVARVENVRPDREKGVVKVGLQGTGSVTINDIQSIRVYDGNVVGSKANNGSYFLSKVIDSWLLTC